MDKKKSVKSKEKKPKIKFEEIDITTATEDDIIKSGIRQNTKKDIICYGIMTFIFVMIFVPPLLRILIPKPITEVEREVVYIDLTCYRTVARDGYELSGTLNSKYRDGAVEKVVLEYAYKKINEDAKNDYSFAEINEFMEVDNSVKGLKKEKLEDKYVFTMDFENYNEELEANDLLSNYSYIYGVEINYLNTQGFYCSTKSETVMERVYVDTGKKVE